MEFQILRLLAEVWSNMGDNNPLEPLAFKLPVVSGKHTFNFPEVFTSLLEVQGVLQINSTEKALSEIIDKLLNSKGARQRLGNARPIDARAQRVLLMRTMAFCSDYSQPRQKLSGK